MELRNAAFQQLKPPCVALSQAILVFRGINANGGEVTACLSRLFSVLQKLAEKQNIDSKLADYVFFPLSQVLSASQKLPLQAMELSLQCLHILISQGWRATTPPSLSCQLIILLTFTADRSTKVSASDETTDDLQRVAFMCMTSLFVNMSQSLPSKSSLTQAANVPSLGHAMTTILDGISESRTYDVQLAATEALEAIVKCLTDRAVMASFLPGIVSVLSKVLTPSTLVRRPWKALAKCLKVLETVFRVTVSDRSTKQPKIINETSDKNPETTRLDDTWLQATAGQLKLALATIDRLRTHGRREVRDALLDLNLMLVSECRVSLANSRQLALETALVLVEGSENDSGKMRLGIMVRGDSSVADLLQNIFRDWTISLSRIMQSADDQAKERRLRQVFTAFQILMDSGIAVRSPHRVLASALQESVSIIVQLPAKAPKSVSQRIEPVMLQDLPLLDTREGTVAFADSLSASRSQTDLLHMIRSQVQAMARSTPTSDLASDFVCALRQSEGDAQVATFYLLLAALDTPPDPEDPLAEFLDFGDVTDSKKADLLEDVHDFALTMMEDDLTDWRLRALSLETIALSARTHGAAFRSELIDVLYPVLYHLGSDVPALRNHAIVALNIISKSCEYNNVKDLIVQNVDYLVNAVALKLNAFDVSPQGPQVLLMMVKLAGPSLLPYLEDTVESIFAALEDYHGYPLLVELLFKVLGTMAEEGVKAPQLAITGHEDGAGQIKDRWEPTNMATLVQILVVKRQKDTSREKEEEEDFASAGHPQRPWKEGEAKAAPKSLEELLQEDPEDADEDADTPAQPTEPPPPAPKTYSLLLKITQLTQHYLSFASPSLRNALLSLIGTTIPALARHQDTYLPLVNTLWPELVSRLRDSEPYILATSLDIIRTMCEYAGSFMRSRIQSLWPEIKAIHRRLAAREGSGGGGKSSLLLGRAADRDSLQVSSSSLSSSSPSSAGYIDTSTKNVASSLEKLLLGIVKHVGLDADLFDETLVMLRPLSRLPPEARAILEEENADALWLASYKEKPYTLRLPRVPKQAGWRFAEITV